MYSIYRIISPHPDEITLNRDKSVLQKLIPSNSNRQIQYNVKKYEKFVIFIIKYKYLHSFIFSLRTCHDQENEHFPVKRLLSIESKGNKESTDIEES